MKRIGVMQVIDTLTHGGAERVAVNLANLLPSDRFDSSLCATREGGVLEESLSRRVTKVELNRGRRFDLRALGKLVATIRRQNIQILHAHASSLFLARAAGRVAGVAVVWHDHFGQFHMESRSRFLYGLATRGIEGVISVSQDLAGWARDTLGVPRDRVWYIPNFVDTGLETGRRVALPGTPGRRIVCVANFRGQKDHMNLLAAMKVVVEHEPSATLILLGSIMDADYYRRMEKGIAELGLSRNVECLGERTDVPDLLRGCDIGVLSSLSEGLPLSLLEYGAAGLAAVVTDVGQCREVLNGGQAGILVPPSDSKALGEALLRLVQQPNTRARYGKRLRDWTRAVYGQDRLLEQICGVYDSALRHGGRIGRAEREQAGLAGGTRWVQ